MDNIDKLLLELKKVLSVIDDNYITKIESILDGDSEYDRLFYHYVKRFGIDEKNSKALCIDRIKSVAKKYDITDYYILLDLDNESTITDIYRIIDDNIYEYYGDINHLQSLIEKKENVICGIYSVYGIKRNEEIAYIKLYLSNVFYSYISSYIDIVGDDDYYVNEDTSYIDIYKSLNEIKETRDVIDIFDKNMDEIIDIYDLYMDLDKHGRDLIHMKMLKSDSLMKSIKICPFSITMYKDYYNLYYKNEKLKSIEIGNITLTIMEDMIKDSYDNNYNKNDIYKRTINIIKGSNKEYDTLKWFDYLAANVYENILNKEIINRNEKMFVDYINQGETNFINNDSLLEYILYKFYEFNNEIYDVKSLKNLRNNINSKNKIMIKKINPYYDDLN